MARDDERGSDPDAERERARALERNQRSRGGKLILVLSITVLLMLFAVQNAESTRLRFLWFEFQPPLIWVIVGVGLAGALVGFLVGRPNREYRRRARDAGERGNGR